MFRGLKIRLVNLCVNHIYVGTNKKHFEKKRKLLNSLGHSIGSGTKIVGPVTCTGRMVIGKNCWIGRNFIVHGNGTAVIGDNCDIAPDVSILTGGHEIGSDLRRAGNGYIKDVTIGNGCWICARSTILGGVTIGNSVVVAACACVTIDAKDNTLVGGVPARFIRELHYD